MKMPSELLATDAQTNLQQFFAHSRLLIDAQLDRLLPAESVAPETVHQAMRWSLFAGGKRFRPALLVAVGEALGAAHEQLLKSACALEMIHTYSLIHDDLPSMDNDDLRRGRPTCHVRFGEATATLAGDALQTLAFQTIAEDDDLSAATRVRVTSELARGAGTPGGMVAGQAFDLEAESRPVTPAELQQIHQLKTGALIVAAARCGAIIANASSNEVEIITEYAAHLGLLFQITDDLLDVTASAKDLGKTPGKDARAKKATYPGLYGVEAARQRAMIVHEQACASLDRLHRPTSLLQALATFILQRNG
jgi:geranylgeranyl diphosphate synthase type II